MVLVNPLRYRGYYYDTETGFYYLGSRYYDPQMYRFLNADSFIMVSKSISGINLFSYCESNPIVYDDINGYFRTYSVTMSDSGTNRLPNASSNHSRILNSINNKRPNTGEPNSTYNAPNGDKRVYDDAGKPKRDYDHNDHGNPKSHPHDDNGGHYHDWDWSKDPPRGPAYVPTGNPDLEFIFGAGLVAVGLIGATLIIADDATGVGVVDDAFLIPIGAEIEQGFSMITG